MALENRQPYDREAQRRLIIATARSLAEQDGWSAVTSRRLSAAIGYSQPVLYKHFASIEEIVDASALEGFKELAEALRVARGGAGAPEEVLARLAHAYCSFALENPALYDAMFTRASRLRFASDDTPLPLSAAFAELRAAVDGVANGGDVDTLTEVLWAGLHGLTALGRDGRLRKGRDFGRIELLVAQFSCRPS
jgi:AcrR family transcriptional regulator